jgi:soluble lytic murein transglycosylase-like protein
MTRKATTPTVRCARALALSLALGATSSAWAGAQAEEQLAPSVAQGLSRAIADQPVPADWASRAGISTWLAEMSRRVGSRIPDERERLEFLLTAHYEATRAGLDPQLVLGIVHHESGFRKYAVSVADARGYMQVMPFWMRMIGDPSDQNLFQLRTNLRYGCVILRHYLDREGGDVFRALGRYNGSLGKAEYPQAVLAAMQRYTTQLASGGASVGTALAVH